MFDSYQESGNYICRALLMVVKSWRVEFQKDARFKCIPPLEGENSSKNEESLFCLRERITIAVMILEILVSTSMRINIFQSIVISEGKVKCSRSGSMNLNLIWFDDFHLMLRYTTSFKVFQRKINDKTRSAYNSGASV